VRDLDCVLLFDRHSCAWSACTTLCASNTEPPSRRRLGWGGPGGRDPTSSTTTASHTPSAGAGAGQGRAPDGCPGANSYARGLRKGWKALLQSLLRRGCQRPRQGLLLSPPQALPVPHTLSRLSPSNGGQHCHGRASTFPLFSVLGRCAAAEEGRRCCVRSPVWGGANPRCLQSL